MTSTDLIQVETLKPSEVFTPGGVEKLIADVEGKVRSTSIDTSTEWGRASAKSLAFKVVRSKTALDEMGKNFVAELKRAAGVVDADRRIIRERFDALRDEVRKPVDEFEAAEDDRKNGHIAAMQEIQALGQFSDPGNVTVAQVKERLGKLGELHAIRDWQEFADRAGDIYAGTGFNLDKAFADATKRDADRAELEQLRKDQAERQESERKAQAEKQEAERKARAEQEQRERDERIAAQAKQEVERERLAAVARAERAERDARDAAEKAERDREAAVAAERKRATDVKAAEEAATAKREANKKHRCKIHAAAQIALIGKVGLSDEQALAVVNAIANGLITNVKIEY